MPSCIVTSFGGVKKRRTSNLKGRFTLGTLHSKFCYCYVFDMKQNYIACAVFSLTTIQFFEFRPYRVVQKRSLLAIDCQLYRVYIISSDHVSCSVNLLQNFYCLVKKSYLSIFICKYLFVLMIAHYMGSRVATATVHETECRHLQLVKCK